MGGEAGRSQAASDCLQTPGWSPSQVTFIPEQTWDTGLVQHFFCRNWYSVKPQLFRFLEMLALNESSELEPDLARCILYIVVIVCLV